MLRAVKHIRGCLVDGHRPGVCRRIRMLLPDMKLEGFKLELMFAHTFLLPIHFITYLYGRNVQHKLSSVNFMILITSYMLNL